MSRTFQPVRWISRRNGFIYDEDKDEDENENAGRASASPRRRNVSETCRPQEITLRINDRTKRSQQSLDFQIADVLLNFRGLR